MAAKSDGPATTLLIPVSWGEFFDKISILEIKKEKECVVHVYIKRVPITVFQEIILK